MHKRKKRAILLILIGISLLLFAACGGDGTEEVTSVSPAETQAPSVETDVPTVEDTEEPAPVLIGDSLRGGLLYDKWWVPLGLDEPEGDHPLWASQTSNERSGKDTWRCKECHGWDYKGVDGAYGSGSHMTGFTGVIQFAGGDANEVVAALQGADHDFSMMGDQALIDLALFITEETVDYSTLIGEDKAALNTDTALGETLFQDTCASCHGPEGLAINFKSTVSSPEYLSGLSGGNPWEFLHKARFGQPGEDGMPSVLDEGWSEEEQGALLAYAQSLPSENLVTQGGLMYDKWWAALGVDEPEGDNPLWATQDSNTRSGKDTWRCKECHGWDYMGVDGAYGSGSHMTGFAGVFSAADMSADEISSWMTGGENADHDFSAYLDDAAIDMFVAFLQEGMVDMSSFVNEDKSVNADASLGEALYEQACARCHGDDGQGINFGDEADPTYAGDVADSNPWETFHKAANGQPGEYMTSGFNMGWSIEDIFNIVAYVQTLND
ncbi:MAG: cytochrome c [Chloroflexi bacterium]|nr:cytochrome c [Chloroflexota bacterium]